jgi:hypothetical protein
MPWFNSRRWAVGSTFGLALVACEAEPRPSVSFQIDRDAQEPGDGGKGASPVSGGQPGAGKVGAPAGTGGQTNSSGGRPNAGSGGSGAVPMGDGGASDSGGSTARGGSIAGGSAGRASTGGKSASGGAASGSGGTASTGGRPPTGGATGGSGEGGSSEPSGEFFGDSRCSDDFDLCEDFETGGLDTGTWSTMGAAPTLDNTRAARGERSAHFHSTDNGLMLIRTTNIFPVANNNYFGRLFVWFDALPSAPQWAHWTIAGAQGGGEAEIRVGGQFDGQINRFGVGTDHGATGDWTRLDEDSDEPVPVRTWLCVEWQHDGAADETRLWIGGVERTSLRTAADDHGGDDGEEYLLPEFESAWVGFWQYATGVTPEEFDVWIDEVAFDGERIGCER